MTEAQEVRARAKALRERREELEKALAGAAGPGARPLRLELARVKEELVDCARRLKELMPSHKVRCRTTWAGVDGWQWDRFQYQTWAELEGAGAERGQPCLPLCGEPLGSCHRAALAGHGRRGGGLCVHLGAPACQGPTAAQKKLNRTAQDIPFDKYDRNVTNWAAKAVKVLVSTK